jgi:hypothetical protein
MSRNVTFSTLAALQFVYFIDLAMFAHSLFAAVPPFSPRKKRKAALMFAS